MHYMYYTETVKLKCLYYEDGGLIGFHLLLFKMDHTNNTRITDISPLSQ